MARPGLTRHRKFLRLAQIVASEALALGHLEFLWESAYEVGSPECGTSAEVEAAARWKGSPGALTAALVECGFVDEVAPGEFEIHDFWTHAPRYVINRAQREAAREQRGVSLSQIRREAGKKGAAARWQEQGKQVASDGNRMASEWQIATTPSTQHGKEERESTSSPPAADAAPSWPSLTLEQAIGIWVATCPHLSRPRPTERRRRQLAARCRDAGFVDSFRDVCMRIGRSRFCGGHSDRGWRADLGWLLERPEAWVKVLEGKYDDAPQQLALGPAPISADPYLALALGEGGRQ